MTPIEKAGRFQLDFKVVSQLETDIFRITAYRSGDDLRSGIRPIVSLADADQATHYRVDYFIPTLVGPGKIHGSTTVHFDLMSGGNYPFTEPTCWVISEPFPWSPHFWRQRPICIGSMWRDARGHILLAHLIIHVARLLNFDEVGHSPGYEGWNRQAIDYWKNVMKCQPVTAGLRYPALPIDITHGIQPAKSGSFRGITRSEGQFSGVFRPKHQGGI
jgi:hypothetical protein